MTSQGPIPENIFEGFIEAREIAKGLVDVEGDYLDSHVLLRRALLMCA